MTNYDGKDYLHFEESDFADGKMVTDTMLKKFWNDDSWLKRNTDQLWKESMPVTRKRFNPFELDENKSYSVVLEEQGGNTVVGFDEKTKEYYQLDFYNEKHEDIDYEKTNAILNQEGQLECRKSYKDINKIDKNTRTYSSWVRFKDNIMDVEHVTGDSFHCNEHWYISYPRDKKYSIKKGWKKSKLAKMPSICRAHTFKPTVTGLLKSITLNLKKESRIKNELFVEIFETEEHTLKNGRKMMFPVSRYKINKHKAKLLAREKGTFYSSKPSIVTIPFRHPIHVVKGKSYAFVLRSPLTKYSSAYRVGGWSHVCNPYPYSAGNAFLSEDNGYTWIPYGKTDGKLSYHQGRRQPLYFAFGCDIEVESEIEKYEKSTIYSKLIMFNEIREFTLIHDHTILAGTNIEYYYSLNGEKWKPLNDENHYHVNFDDDPHSDKLRNSLIFKIILTPTNEITPTLNNVALDLVFEKPLEAVARTKIYSPETEGILAAHVFGGISTPYSISNPNKCSVNVDLVRDIVFTDNFIISDPKLILEQYEDHPSVEKHNIKLKELIDSEKWDELKEYIDNNIDLIVGLRKDNIYLKDHIIDNKFYLKDNVSYPIHHAYLSEASSDTITLSEWVDFTVDYTENCIILRDDFELSTGNFTVEYNPCFMKNIEKLKTDDGLVHLDYQEEKFTVTSEMKKENNITYKLSCSPHDPLKKVSVFYDNVEKELFEDKDYIVDYFNHTINFSNDLIEGSVVTIVYVTDYTDSDIILQYNLKRESVDENITLLPYSIYYKT